MPIPVNDDMVDTIAGDDLWEQENISYSINLQEAGHQTSAAEDKFGNFPAFIPVNSHDWAAIQEAVELWDDLIDNSITENNVPSSVISVNQVTNIPSYSGGSTFGTLHQSVSGADNEGVYLKADAITVGTYAFTTAIHEFGHALGLSHPGDYNASVDEPTYQNDRTFDEDTVLFSIMSYFKPTDNPSYAAVNWTADAIRTPMIYDILAIQQLYGADTTTRTGDTTYGFNTEVSDFRSPLNELVYSFTETTTDSPNHYTTPSKAVFTIWDAGGDHDRIDASKFAADQRIDLTPGSYSDIGETAVDDPDHAGQEKLVALVNNIGIAFGTTIEEAIGGSGNDTIIGNNAGGYLDGGAGNDTIRGGEGDDTIKGGDDLSAGGRNDDILSGGGGDDLVDGGLGQDLLHGGSENDILNGGDGNDVLYGDDGLDTLDGGKGKDWLDGGGTLFTLGGPGVVGDILTGGEGDDTFIYGRAYGPTRIVDFSQGITGNNDTLDLTKIPVHNFTDLVATGSQQGADTVFSFGGFNKLTLQNFQLSALTPDGILFSEATEGPPPNFALTQNPNIGNLTPYTTFAEPLSSGGFMAVSLAHVVRSYIYAQVFDSRGAPIPGNTIQINTTPLAPAGNWDGSQNGFHLTRLLDGKIVAAWSSNTVDSQGHTQPYQIRARIFYADGTPVGDDFAVNLTPPVIQNNGSNFFSLSELWPSISGGFVVDWVTDVTPGQTDDQLHLLRRGFDANGVGTAEEDLGAATFPGTGPKLLRLSSEETLEYWQESYSGTGFNGDGAYSHIYAAILLRTGVVQLDVPSFGAIPFYSNYTASELADGRILFTYTGGNFSYTGGSLSQYIGGTTAIIYDHNLQGFTKPGTAGDDFLQGGLYGDRLYGLDGNDLLMGGLGADLLDGGLGTDTVTYSDSLEGVIVDLNDPGSQAGGHAEGDSLVSIENILGSSYLDNLTGDAGVNVIYGGYGGDYIFGGGGADQLHGEHGDDHVALQGYGGTAWGEAGNDALTVTGDNNTLWGGVGEDTLTVITGNSNTLNGGDDVDHLHVIYGISNVLYGDGGNDVIIVEDGINNTLIGGDDNDIVFLRGSGFSNQLFGGAGDDNVNASEHTGPAVWLYGGGDDDWLEGSQGDDMLSGDAGDDIIFGHDGIDTARFSGYVTDYRITYGPNERLTVTDLRAGSPDGTDIIGAGDVEFLSFNGMSFKAGYFHTTSKVADGYIKGAAVFADANHNGVQDASEASATTDIGGGFTLPVGAAGPLVLTGGIDTGTGLPFGGRLLAPAGYHYITPLTTLVELLIESGVANAQQKVLTNLGPLGVNPAADLANLDPVIQDLLGNYQPEMTGIRVANTVDLIASAIEGAHPGQFGVAYDDAFKALAAKLGSGAFDLSSLTAVTGVINATLTIGGFTLDPSVVSGLAQIIVAFNSTATQLSGLEFLDAVAKVAQGEAAAAIKLAGADPSKMPDATSHFTGQSLQDAVMAQYMRAGDAGGPYYNNAPLAQSDSYTMAADDHELIVDPAHGLLANDLDSDGDALTALEGSQTEHGTVTINADGSFRYTPDTGFAGTDSFYYYVDDGTTQSFAQATIQVDGPHPVVTNITVTPSSGVLYLHDNITITVTMSSAVTINQTNAPLFLFTNYGNAQYQVNLSDPDTLVFTMSVEDYTPIGVPLQITGDDNDENDAHVFDALTSAMADLSGADLTFSGITVACYCRDTLILTDGGELPVQDLAIGDRVVTASGATRPIKWIGRRSYGGRFLIGQKHILPVRIMAGALAENTPRRDLWISPHHAMYLEGVLIEARDLVNGTNVVQPADTADVEYFHIELDSHDVIVAEGALFETFVDDDSRGMFHNVGEYYALYPDEAAEAVPYYAPRCDAGYEVEAARRKIAQCGGLRSGLADGGGKLRGYVDVISPTRIDGWAQNENHPEAPVCLDIIVDGVCIGQVLANRYRRDLLDAGLGSGHHSFSYVAKPGQPIGSGLVEIRRSLDGAPLPASARCCNIRCRAARSVDRSAVMKHAWTIFRDGREPRASETRRQRFAVCLRQAWAEAGKTKEILGSGEGGRGMKAAA